MNSKTRNIFITLFTFATMPFQAFSQKTNGFEVTAHLDGLEDGFVVKLYNNHADWHTPVFMDSCVVVNGSFHLKSRDMVSEEPRGYHIWFFKGRNGHSYGSDSDFDPREIYFLVDNGDKINIHGNIRQLQIKDLKITGSRANEAKDWALSIAKYADSCYGRIIRRLGTIRDSIGYDKGLVEEQVNAKRDLDRYLDSATKHIPPHYQEIVPFLILTLHDWLAIYHGYFQRELYAKLSFAVQTSYFGLLVKDMVVRSVGQTFPTFSLPTQDGSKIDLKVFLSKGRITIVHFWSTSSVEREMYQSELKALYSKFHDKGLNVIAVSADTTKDDWEFMIHQKKYPWTNVIAEPAGWGKGSLINDVYGEGGHYVANTTNVMLDDKGKILAWDVYGAELQWYLEKYLGEQPLTINN